MAHLPGLELSVVAPEEIPLAAEMAARAMADNPTSLVMFGPDRARRIADLTPVFDLVLSTVGRQIVCARRGGSIAGIAAMAPPGRCLFRLSIEGARSITVAGKQVTIGSVPHIPLRLILPLLRLGPRGLGRVSAMSEVHMQHDPAERHQHVELVAVEPAVQGLGVGRLMMEELCRQIDEDPSPAWLETDTADDVRFYRHYGFEVVTEEDVLGVRNWYMRRG